MKKRILLLMNCKEREQYIARLIETEINNLGEHAECKVLYWNQKINWEEDVFFFRPDVVFTFPPTFVPLINRLMQIKVICGSVICSFVTEGFIQLEELEKDNNWLGYYDYPYDLVDFHCYWGKKVAEYCWENLKEKDRVRYKEQIKVFGYPLWETQKILSLCELKKIESHFDKICKSYKNVVMVLSGFSEANKTYEDICHSEDAINQKGLEEDKQEQIQEIAAIYHKLRQYREEYYVMLDKLAKKNPDTLFMLKLHPKESEWKRHGRGYDYSVFNNSKNILIIEEMAPIGFFWKWVNLLIHYGSTAGLEAYVAKIPNIRIQSPDNQNRIFREDIFSDAVFDADMIEEISNYIFEKKSRIFNTNNTKYVEDYFNYYEGKPYEPSKEIASFLMFECKDTIGNSDSYGKYAAYEYLDDKFSFILLKYTIKAFFRLRLKETKNGISVLYRYCRSRKKK